MIDIMIGIVVFGIGAVGLWYFMPHNGQLHPFITMPILDTVIPVSIVSTLGLALAMIIAGVTGMMT